MIRLLRLLYRALKILIIVRWVKSIYVNFRLLPPMQAAKLPIIIISDLILDSLSGNIIIEGPIEFGMIIIGRNIDNMPISDSKGRLKVEGVIRFNGKCQISKSASICVHQKGLLELGKFTRIASGVFLKCVNRIIVGDYTRITSGCFIMDSNIHLIKDVSTGRIKKPFGEINIGSCCWVTMNSTIMQGAIIPDYCIIGRGSYINSDYSKQCNPGSFLLGAPAKVVKENVQLIFDYTKEERINELFYNDLELDYIDSTIGFETPDPHIINQSF